MGTKIKNVRELLNHGGKVVKYKKNGDRAWTFGILCKSPGHFTNHAAYGLGITNQISLNGVHSLTSITDLDFKSHKAVVETASPEEYKNIKFSYDAKPS